MRGGQGAARTPRGAGALDRRSVLRLGGAAALVGTLPACEPDAVFSPRAGGWRRFETTTRLTLAREGEAAQAWVPVPSLDEPGWSRAGEVRWETDADAVSLGTDRASGARFVHAAWRRGTGAGRLDVKAEAEARSRSVDLGAPQGDAPLTPADRARYLAPTALIPTDGLVAETAAVATSGAHGDLAKARALYDWVVRNTARNPKTRGCGPGDVGTMLAIGDLSGKCADINALFVGLARASGLPARDLYGLRVAPSRFGYASLGASSSDVTGAQHCRAGVYLDGLGWVPADPADVRKVMLEEEAEPLPLRHPKVRAVRDALFGAWEGNWIAYNDAHDIALPGAEAGPVPFLMYPQAEVGGARLDPLDPARFAYRIEARTLSA